MKAHPIIVHKGFSLWILFSLVITLTAGGIYVTVQQFMRHFADYPQMQIAVDTAQQVANGRKIHFSPIIDIAQSTAPFLMLYDSQGNLQSSQAMLNNNTPSLPLGVLMYAKAHGMDRITWEPQAGVRIASIIVYYNTGTNHGFVLGGRSLKEIELWEEQLLQEVIAFWGISIIAIGFTIVFLHTHFKHSEI